MKTTDSYQVTKFLVSSDGEILKQIKENDTITITTAKDKASDNHCKFKKMMEDRDALSLIISKECGSFYFDFFNRGLDSMDIKDSVKARFLFLCTYASYIDSGSILTYDNGVKIDRKGLKKLLGGSDYECNNTLKTMIDNELLFNEGDYFKINDRYAKRGSLTASESKEDCTRIFDKGLRELYNGCSQKQHKQLYYIFKILPYVSPKFNSICSNPNEQAVEKIKPLKLSEICERVGYTSHNAKKFEKEMLKLQLFGEYAMVGIINGKGVWYKLNPKVTYAGTLDNLEEFYNLLSTDFKVKI